MEWGTIMRHIYHILNQQSHRHHGNNKKKQKNLHPRSWAKGLIALNGQYVYLLWEDRINIVKSQEKGPTKHDNHYFLLQKAYHNLAHHHVLNPDDNARVIKSQDKLSKLSSDHVQLCYMEQ